MNFNTLLKYSIFSLLVAVSNNVYSFGVIDRAADVAETAVAGAADVAGRAIDTAADVTEDVVAPRDRVVVYEERSVEPVRIEEPTVIKTTETVPVVTTPAGTVTTNGIVTTPAFNTTTVVEPTIK